MFKKTWNSQHFLRRHASHSTKGSRTGRVDVLPPGATLKLYDIAQQIADGDERIANLRNERDQLEAERHKLARLDAVRMKHASDLARVKASPDVAELQRRIDSIDGLMSATRKHIGELRSVIGDGQRVTFETAFLRLARAELPHDVFETLSAHALIISTRATK